MTLLCVYRGDDFPSSRIRILQMRPLLDARGIGCRVVPYPRSRIDLVRLCREAGRSDLIWLQKKLPSFADAVFWRLARTPVVFDFDDAIQFRLEPKRESYRSRTRERRFRRMTRLAAAFTCGNDYLASFVKPLGKPVLIYPSPVPVDVPTRSYADRHARPVVGWIGDARNLGSLRRIAPALAAAARRHPFTLRVISNGRIDLAGVEVENIRWSLERQDGLVADFDIGLMPLDGRSSYDRGKCAYKLLQYMAAGVAPAADPVGMNAEVIRDGENGRLVGDGLTWESVLDDLLAGGPERLAVLGAAARKTVEQGFTYDRHAGALVGFFDLVSRRRGHSRIAHRHWTGEGMLDRLRRRLAPPPRGR